MEIQLLIGTLSLAGLAAGVVKMFRRNPELVSALVSALDFCIETLLDLVKAIFIPFGLLGESILHKLRFLLRFRSWLAVSRGSGKERPEHYVNALSRADLVFNLIGLLLPSRIMKEDAGDAREVIDKLAKASAPTWMIYTKLTSSVCWILLAAVREVLTVTKKKPN